MDDFQHSLLKNRKFSIGNACYQTSGTPSKCAVSSFADYNEIFGNLFPPRSSPVPILDFPLLEDDQVSPGIPSSNLDYSDIFGCLCVGDFDGAYEQVVAESYGPEYSPTKISMTIDSSEIGIFLKETQIENSLDRLQDAKGTRLQAPATVSSASLEVCDQELLASTKKYYAPSNVNSQHIHNEAKLFNMSYKRSNQIIMRDSLCGMVGPAYDDKLPGITVLSVSCFPRHKDKSADSLTQGTRNLSQDSTMMEVDHIGEIISQHPVEKSQKDCQVDHIQHDCILGDSKDATLSEHSMLNSFSSHMLQSDLKKNQEGLSTASDCDPEIGNDLNPSCHLVSYLPSGKDTSSQGNVFLTVTDIDLQTQPSQLPPPSRLPPKLGSPQRMKCSQDVLNRWKPLRVIDGYQFGPGFKTHALDESGKNESSPLFDVVADADSTAPSSAAAIREAMDKAKAKLKSAKESLERTRGEYPDCMKLGLYEHKKINERKESGSAQESLILKDDEAPEGCSTRNHELKEGYGNNMGHVELIKESLYRFKDDSSRFLDTHKLEDRTAERKVNKQFYDLANNEENCKIILEWDNDKANSMPFVRNLMHKQKTTETLQEEDVLEKNEILRMVNETNERAHYSIPKAPDRACRCKEGDKKVEATQVSGQMEETKKTKVAAEAPEQEDEIECESGLVAGSHIEHEKRLKAACEHDDGTTRLKAASEYAEEKGLKGADKNEEASNRLKMANKHEEEEMKLKAACDHVEEKRLRATQRLDEEERSIKAAHDCAQEVKRLIVTCVHSEEAKRLNAACAFEEEDKILKAAHDYEEVENRLKAPCEDTQEEKREKAAHLSETETSLKYGHDVEEISREVANKGYGSEGYCEKVVPHEWKEVETKLRSSLESHIDGEHAKKKESVRQLEEREKLVEMVKRGHAHYVAEESLEVRKGNKKLREIQDTHEIEGSENIIEAAWKVYVGSDKREKTQENKVAKLQVQEAQILKQADQVYEWEARENKQRTTCEKNEENNKKVHAVKAVLLKDAAKSKAFCDALRWDHNEKEQKAGQTVQEQERNEKKLEVLKQACDTAANEQLINELEVLHDKDKINNITPARENIKEAEAEREKVAQFDCCLNRGEKLFRTALQVTMSQDREREDKTTKKVYEKEEKEKEERVDREREQEKERLRKLEEDIEREREREKDRIAVERARSEACATELVKARERLEKASLDSVTTEARLRALAEARERSEKASLDVARMRAERAAAERAIAEARQRAAEKVIADRTAASNCADGELWQSSDAQDINGTDGHPSIRCKARLERHQRIVERTAKALAEKSLRDIIVQREQAERNSLAETLDADVRRWSNGKEGNLRALLSTLQYVLGSESGWQPISLTDVITAAAVKKAYRKATLCVHPDKVQQRGASIQQKYICEKVFDLLKDAWNKFNSEGW